MISRTCGSGVAVCLLLMVTISIHFFVFLRICAHSQSFCVYNWRVSLGSFLWLMISFLYHHGSRKEPVVYSKWINNMTSYKLIKVCTLKNLFEPCFYLYQPTSSNGGEHTQLCLVFQIWCFFYKLRVGYTDLRSLFLTPPWRREGWVWYHGTTVDCDTKSDHIRILRGPPLKTKQVPIEGIFMIVRVSHARSQQRTSLEIMLHRSALSRKSLVCAIWLRAPPFLSRRQPTVALFSEEGDLLSQCPTNWNESR